MRSIFLLDLASLVIDSAWSHSNMFSDLLSHYKLKLCGFWTEDIMNLCRASKQINQPDFLTVLQSLIKLTKPKAAQEQAPKADKPA